MPILRLLAVVTVAALGLSACGVRGDLEPPPGAATVAAPDGQTEPALPEGPVAAGPDMDVFEEDDEGTERVIQSQRRTRFPPVADSFVLDPLL